MSTGLAKSEFGFKIVFCAVFFVLFIYSSHQIVRFTEMAWSTQFAIVCSLFLPFALGVSQPLFFWDPERPYHAWWVHWVEVGGYLSINYVNDLILICLVRDVVSFFNSNFLWYELNLYSTNGAIICLIAPLTLMTCGFIVVWLGPYYFKVKIRHNRIPREFNGYKIIQLSDIHVGAMVGHRILKKIINKVNKLKPDLIVLTGDIIDGDPLLYSRFGDDLVDLKAKDGVIYVTGNHEYYWGVDVALDIMKKQGFTILMNENIRIKRQNGAEIEVSGIPDPSSRYFNHIQVDWDKVDRRPGQNHFRVLLAHKPAVIKESKKRGFDLQLSGHTHAGQFFPWNLLISWFQKYPKGKFKVDNTILYVNQGTAFWGPPNRLGTWGEISVIELRNKRSDDERFLRFKRFLDEAIQKRRKSKS